MRKIFIAVSILLSSASAFALDCPRDQSPGGIIVYSNVMDCESGLSAEIFSPETPSGERRCLVNHSSTQVKVDASYLVCWKPTGESNLTVEVLDASLFHERKGH